MNFMVHIFLIAVLTCYTCSSLTKHCEGNMKPEVAMKICKIRCHLSDRIKYHNKTTDCYTLPNFNYTTVTKCVKNCLQKCKKDMVDEAVECKCIDSRCVDTTTTTISESNNESEEDSSLSSDEDSYSDETDEQSQ